MDLAYDIAKFVVDIKYADLSSEAVDIGKKDILDIFGVILAGSKHEVIRKLLSLVDVWGGIEQSSVLVYGKKYPLPGSVLVNSAMANALDYDDTHERGGTHNGCVVVPSALAFSEFKGTVTGKEFLTTVCMGIELGC